MAREYERSARGQIQQSLGDRGVVLPYSWHSGPGRPAPGWYVQPHAELAGCDCQFCSAARNGEAIYVGYHRRDAIERIGVYKHEHPAAA